MIEVLRHSHRILKFEGHAVSLARSLAQPHALRDFKFNTSPGFSRLQILTIPCPDAEASAGRLVAEDIDLTRFTRLNFQEDSDHSRELCWRREVPASPAKR